MAGKAVISAFRPLVARAAKRSPMPLWIISNNAKKMKSLLANAKHIVVKVGSSLVTDEGRGLDRAAIAAWADQIARLTRHGKQVILVSSGAVAEGMQRSAPNTPPTTLNQPPTHNTAGQL